MKRMIIFLLTITIALSGCNSVPQEIKDSVDTEKLKEAVDTKKLKDAVVDIVVDKLEEQEQVMILKEYYEYIQQRASEDKILNFLKENIKGLDEKRVDEMLIQLENHLSVKGYDTKGILEKVSPYLQYASDELKSYFKLWDNEVHDQTTDGESTIKPADEILKRALDAEKHIQSFPEGKTRDRIEELYRTYLKMGIEGLGNQYIYAEEGENKLSQEVQRIYEKIIADNPGSWTSKLLEDYLSELNKDSMNLDGPNAEYFFDNLDDIIDNIERQ